VFFQTNCDESELKKSVMRHRYYATKLTSQDFSISGLTQSKFLATPVLACDNLKKVNKLKNGD